MMFTSKGSTGFMEVFALEKDCDFLTYWKSVDGHEREESAGMRRVLFPLRLNGWLNPSAEGR